ncbi:uncharacterized protein PG986_009998 [Apiospora aurea]|uniref:Gem-associated protein 5 TPR domain-containing protein n=1 Tax=Apiospora aurea TaxID=335848 RepID=A0ABR1Q998_9PEZI
MSSRSHPSVPRHPHTSIASSAKSSQRTGKTVAEPRDFTSPTPLMKYFEPCAATAGMLLYGQGNSIVVAHHDSLTIERRFSRHSAEVQLLAVDTQSDIGAGRLVVSYDTDMTAIVWDLMTGDEVARFASYENLTCAAWMRNGNVAFGNTQGNIILFEPTTSEHISARTIDQISVTALAPAADCRTFAIGYQNGSLLIATLQPRFTILHNLSTNRAPSPIVNLAWHASSSRQKSDMLAVQTNDGDLRVWSVAKSYSSDDPAKVVRILKRTENYQNAPNWMGWSKNGRIIQFSESETLSWDVRTKHVTYDSIPTLEHVRGLAVYGPGATLFTLGANNTVQQFDLNTPSQMVANVQHPANLLPPSPPVSIEEQSEHGVVIIATDSDSMSAPESMSIPINSEVSESDDDHMSPLARIVRGAEVTTEVVEPERYMSASPASSRSHASSTASKSSAGSSTRGRHPPSVLSRGMTENTYISAGSSLRSSAQPPPFGDKDAYSISSISSASMTSSSRPSRHRPSRLRNEVPRSPDDSKVHDLFKFTRSRLHDVPYKRAPLVDQTRLTNEDLRRQMLSIIFGWNKEIQDLVRDELSRHPQGSPSRILLSKWLGDIDADVMAASSENMTSSDWMLLALSGIGGQASQHKLGRAYVQRLLESGDLHAAATIMIGMGDHNDAIEIYVSHKRFMEALILLCLYFPNVWERQAQIIKKWGSSPCCTASSSSPYAASHALDRSLPSRGPRHRLPSLNQSIPEVLSPPLSPPGINRGPQRSIAKTSALKLITSFGDQSTKSKFFAAGDGGQTPIAAGVTPIAESAISPSGGYDPATAFIKPSQRSAFNTPSSARVTTPGGFGRQRLPSIGEVRGAEIPTPVAVEESSSKHRRAHHSRKSSSDEQQYAAGLSLGRAATASPQMMRDVHSRRKDPPPPSPSPQSFAALMTQGRTSRNGARDRVPDGIDLKLQSMDAAMSDVTSPEQSVASSTRFHWPTRRRGPGSIASSVTSQSSAGRSHHRAHPPVARGLNDHISSLDAAQRPSRRHRSRDSSQHRNEDHRARSRESSRSREKSTRDASSERGRGAARTYTPKPAKRSPTSPIPMSPEDLLNLSTPRNGEDSIVAMQIDNGEPSTVRKSSQIRRASPRAQRISSRTSSRDTRRRSPERRPLVLEIRGRSDDRDDGSMMRSPSSPLPMSAGGHFFGSDDEKDYQAAVEQQENFRNRHNRSRGMKEPNSPAVSRRDRSESRKRRVKTPMELEAMENPAPLSSQVYKDPARAGAMKSILTERQAKKEAAARELEERRRSLALRPMAPAIPHPDELSPIVSRPPTAFELNQSHTTPPPQDVPQRSATADFTTRSSQMRSGNRPFIGLPATPKAMRLQFESDSKGKPNVPPIPSQWTKTSPPSSGQPSPDKPAAESPAKEAKEPSPLTLLPSTVYSPPSRPMIQRCMSAPIEDQQPPSFQSHSRNGSSARKMSIPEASIRGIDEMLGGVYNGGGKGTIEIVMDDDDNNNYTTNAAPSVLPASDADVPIIAPPQTRHARSQSVTENKDNSIAGRLSRATERMRSASRGRTNSALGQRTKSPEQTSPYESVLPPVSYKGPTPNNDANNGQPQQHSMIERHPREVRATYHTRQNSGTGLSQSEMF